MAKLLNSVLVIPDLIGDPENMNNLTSMKNPLVSIIIPTKNSQEYLQSCLESIVNQSYKNIEIIVVDNNSTDSTKELVKTSKVQHPKSNIYFYNKGPERSAQRNFGAQKAKGKYIYFVDSDFILEKNVVKECIDEISKGFDAIVVHNSPDPTISWIARIRKFEVDMYKYDIAHSAARFFDKAIFSKLRGYNEKVTAGEDYDIQNRLNRNGFKTGFIDAEATHKGEPRSFWKHMYKYYLYGKDFVNYQRENKKESSYQLTPIRNVYLKNWKKFILHPLMGSLFIIYSFFKFGSGGIGFLAGKI